MKHLISMPDTLSQRFCAAIPPRQRSTVLRSLIEKEVEKREKKLFECAKDVEEDDALNEEMADWDATLNDGID